MKWVLISNQKALVQEYHLIENDTSKVIVKYSPLHRSARISCGSKHRLFFIESTGVLTGKYVFKNEYGMEIGNMSYGKSLNRDGIVIIESKKYSYKIQNNPLAEITVFENESQQPVVSCGLTDDSNGTGISFSQHDNNINNSCLLLSLCWYLFLPVSKENVVEYAA